MKTLFGLSSPTGAAEPSTRRRERVKRHPNLVALGDRDLEVLADGEPDLFRVLARGERVDHRPFAEPPDHLVTRDGVRVGSTEVLLHPPPEVGQPHRTTLRRGHDRDQALSFALHRLRFTTL